MKLTMCLCISNIAMIASAAMAEDLSVLKVRNGLLKFEATTNVSAISVHGQSNALEADVQIRRTASGVEIEEIRSGVNPKTLATGMSMRDEHMRKRIFEKNGQLADLQFIGSKSKCPDLVPSKDTACEIAGMLSMHGESRPFTINLKIRYDGKAYRVSADSVVTLSTFGIEPPCQLGVCVNDAVKLRFDFQAREGMPLRSGGLR